VSTIEGSVVLQRTLGRIFGCALFFYGSAALAFTLILPEQFTPSNIITDPTTLEPQVQAIAGTIRTQLFSQLRPRGSAKVAQASRLLAANVYAGSRSDVDFLAAAPGDPSGGGNGGLGGRDSESLWISAMTNSLENEFFRTAFYGATHNLLAGFDLTRSDKYVLGVSLGHEASNFVTTFNAGDQRARGFNLSPYFALLLTDTWSVDLILGYGDFDTRQSRTVGTGVGTTTAVTSEYASTRGFVSTNLTNVTTWGDWKLTGSLGALASKRKQDAYVESDGTPVPALASDTVEQYNLLGEAAYGRGSSEAFLGALYENTRDPQRVQLPGNPQPANDPDSVLLSAGWRHFGKGLAASFVFTTRLAQEEIKEYGFSMLLRFDL
jgi:hypothetical protein